jgi:peptidyl-prolyl cis-trans isomerase B (cyclophilin B)
VTSLRRLSPLVLLCLLAVLTACGEEESSTPRAENEQCSYPSEGTAAKDVEPPPGDPDPDAPEQVTIATDQGNIKLTLEADKAPCAVNSFLSLAKQGFYDDTKCHRLTVQGLYVLQCGDPSGTGQGSPGYRFADELVDNDPRLQPCQGSGEMAYCTYPAGTVALANGNPGVPDSNGSQFFLVYEDSPLPPGYPVLGQMSAGGVQVVRSVAEGGVVPGTEQPKTPVVIESVG